MNPYYPQSQWLVRLTVALGYQLRCDGTHRFYMFTDLKTYPRACAGYL